MKPKMENNVIDVRIRKVKVLDGRAKKKAKDMGLEDKDLVLVKTKMGRPPKYDLTKVEGSPTEFVKEELGVEEDE